MVAASSALWAMMPDLDSAALIAASIFSALRSPLILSRSARQAGRAERACAARLSPPDPPKDP